MFPCRMQVRATQPTLSMRFTTPVQELPWHLERVYGAIMQYLSELGEEHAGAAFALFHTMDMQALDIEAGFPVRKRLQAKGEIQAGEIPGGTYAVCHYMGPYDQCEPAYEQLAQFTREHGYAPGGVVYEWYLDGPDVPPEKTRMDIAFPVLKVVHKMAI